MPSSTKTYRRFRARGTGGDLNALRALNRESGQAAARPGRAERARPAPPPRRPASPPSASGGGRRWGRWAWRGAAVLAVLLVAWGVAGFLVLNNAVHASNDRITKGARAALDEPSGGMLGSPTNTLIIGADARRGETRSRADTILLMRTDPESGEIRYLSIPRDFRVEVPGQGEQKINSAFYFLGQQGMVNAVKRLTGVPVHHLMVIKFNGFGRLVDELGGVTVDNPTALEDCYYEGGQTVTFPKGEIDLDGTEALAFARVRKCDDDFARTARQQALVRGLKDRVISPLSLPFAPWRGADVVNTLNTDIGTIDMVKFAWLQARLDAKPEDRILLSGSPQLIDGQSFVIGDPDANEREIARFMGQ